MKTLLMILSMELQQRPLDLCFIKEDSALLNKGGQCIVESQHVGASRNQANLHHEDSESFTSALQKQVNEAVRITSMRVEI